MKLGELSKDFCLKCGRGFSFCGCDGDTMKFIIVIKGVTIDDYARIREDLTRQMIEREWDLPLFAHLAYADYPDIEIVWLDDEMEIKKYAEVVKQSKGQFEGLYPSNEDS